MKLLKLRCPLREASKEYPTKLLITKKGHKIGTPLVGSIKINVDGAFFFDIQKAVIRFICRDHGGRVILVGSTMERNVGEPKTIEALVVLRSLQHCASQGITHLIMESDCYLLVEELNSSAAPTSKLGNIILDIRNLLAYFVNCQIQYVNRDCDRTSHQLTRHAWCVKELVLWMGNIPPFFRQSCTDRYVASVTIG